MSPSFLPTATHKAREFAKGIAGIVLVLALAGTSFFFGHEKVETPMFDHSVCQYPDRVSNPVDGCDNSDLANPDSSDEIKGVVPAPTTSELQKQESHNIKTVEKPVESVDNTIYDGVLRDNYGNPIAGK